MLKIKLKTITKMQKEDKLYFDYYFNIVLS
jgi:hypothetical protein